MGAQERMYQIQNKYEPYDLGSDIYIAIKRVAKGGGVKRVIAPPKFLANNRPLLKQL